jgi:hypothetical protein
MVKYLTNINNNIVTFDTNGTLGAPSIKTSTIEHTTNGTGNAGELITADGSGGWSWTQPSQITAYSASNRLDVSFIGNGNVSNAEFENLSGVTSNIQSQLTANQTEANLARSIAEDAQYRSNDALTIANDAITGANNASYMADSALTTANSAITIANNAYSMADSAQTTANSTQSTANSAQSTANSALSTANSKVGVADPFGVGYIANASIVRNAANTEWIQTIKYGEEELGTGSGSQVVGTTDVNLSSGSLINSQKIIGLNGADNSSNQNKVIITNGQGGLSWVRPGQKVVGNGASIGLPASNESEYNNVLHLNGSQNDTTLYQYNDATYIEPLRSIQDTTGFSDVKYNSSTKELTYIIGGTSVTIGSYAGNTSQQSNSVAIGSYAGNTSQGTRSVAIGHNAGSNNQQSNSVAIGSYAGRNSQGTRSVAIGYDAGNTNQQYNSIAIGSFAGFSNQQSNSVAIGSYAGFSIQQSNSVAIGYDAGNTSQQVNSVAIGSYAGRNSQQTQSVAIGSYAGRNSQGTRSVAIGYDAGNTNQQSNSIAIGSFAGISNQASNSIVINATGSNLNNATADTCKIAPIRELPSVGPAWNTLYYDPLTNEIASSTGQAVVTNSSINAGIYNYINFKEIANSSNTYTRYDFFSVPRISALFAVRLMKLKIQTEYWNETAFYQEEIVRWNDATGEITALNVFQIENVNPITVSVNLNAAPALNLTNSGKIWVWEDNSNVYVSFINILNRSHRMLIQVELFNLKHVDGGNVTIL